jgi:hypothetical protein
MAVEIPVRYSVLHRHHDGIGAKQLRHLVRHRLELVGLHRQDHQVLRPGGAVVVACLDVRRQLLAAVVHHQLYAVAANGLQIRAAHHAGDVFAGQGELGADITADGARANNRDLHRSPFGRRLNSGAIIEVVR